MDNFFEAGDILQGKYRRKNEAYHPIIYLSNYDANFFIGCMLTHHKGSDNLKFEESHFALKKWTDSRPSYLVNSFLLKRNEWGTFSIIGRLSESGLEFLNQNVGNTKPILWEDFLKRSII